MAIKSIHLGGFDLNGIIRIKDKIIRCVITCKCNYEVEWKGAGIIPTTQNIYNTI